MRANELQETFVTVYRFDVFKGAADSEGRIAKIRSVGVAYHTDGLATYHIKLKTFLSDSFYLLPDEKSGQYSISTRAPSTLPGRKYFWHKVGEAKVMGGTNSGTLKLSFDLFADSLYMNLYPKDSFESAVSEGSTEISQVSVTLAAGEL